MSKFEHNFTLWLLKIHHVKSASFTPMLFPKVLNAKQGNSMYRFSSLTVKLTVLPGCQLPTVAFAMLPKPCGPKMVREGL